MHHGHAQMTHDQNSKPELFLRDVIIMLNKDNNNNNNNNKHDNVYGAVIMAEPLREFTRFI